jgi:DNA-binding MarR family transcriptional regulator
VTRRSPKAELLRLFLLEMLELEGQLARHTEGMTSEYSQTPARWKVLTAAGCDVRTVPQIARRMGMTRQGVQRIANQLVEDGLAEFAANPHHRSSPVLKLTPEGTAVDDAICEAHARWSNGVARQLDADKLEAAIDTFRTLITIVGDSETSGL